MENQQLVIEAVINKSTEIVSELLKLLSEYAILCIEENTQVRDSKKREIKMKVSKICAFLEIAPTIIQTKSLEDVQKMNTDNLKDSEVSFHIPREVLDKASSVLEIKEILECFAMQVFNDKQPMSVMTTIH